MRLWFLLLLLSRCLVTQLTATPQFHDQIIHAGDTTLLLNKLPLGPVDTARLDSLIKNWEWGTACWDGYFRRWIIRNDSLFLDGFLSCHGKNGHFLPAVRVYAGAPEEVFASWVSQQFFMAKGKFITRYDVYLIYEGEIGFKAIDGVIIKQILYSNQGTKIRPQPDPRNFFYDRIPWGTFPDTNRLVVVSFLVDSLGQPQDLKLIRSNGPPYDEMALQLAQQLPPFTVYFYHGELLAYRWNLPISFSRARYRKFLE